MPDLRVELEQLGDRRAGLEREQAKLARDIRRALRRSNGVVPITEAADLLGIHRTTIYRVYGPHR